ncbi:MAG: HU family DNA-binding protein [Bacteroidaceae bacterium]|nr:HU family DNA-binding protein [Bacteroidaceae bacterium]
MKTKKYKTAAHKRGYEIEVACKATSRKLMCGASTETEGMALTVSHPMKVDVASLAKDICDATTATETDVKLVWDAMSERIVEALSHGYRVELAGLGMLNMELSSHMGTTAPTGKEVRISGIRFRPDKNLASRLADVKFRVEGVKRKTLTDAELDEALRKYFTTHEDIHVRELARIGNYAMSTAYRKLKGYVEQGKLELLPKSSSYYRWVGE